MAAESRSSKWHVCNTFVYTVLINDVTNMEQDRLQRACRMAGLKVNRKDFIMPDQLLIPINLNNQHWVLCAASLSQKSIMIIDSLNTGGSKQHKRIGNVMRKFLSYLCSLRDPDSKKTTKFKIKVSENTPQQSNGSDCGLFVCLFIHSIVVLKADYASVVEQVLQTVKCESAKDSVIMRIWLYKQLKRCGIK